MKLIFVRHGQTAWNAEHRLQGSTDIPLNEQGLQQAELLRESLADTPIDTVIASPMLRAKQTAEVICRGRGLAIQEDARAAERGLGRFEGKVMDRPLFDSWWLPDYDAAPDRVEPLDRFRDRVYGLLDDLAERYPDSTVLLVSHGGVSILVKRYFCTGADAPKKPADFLPNCRPAFFEKTAGSRKNLKKSLDNPVPF